MSPPDLRDLLARALGEEPAAANSDRALAIATANRLPLRMTADATGLAADPRWEVPLMREQRAARTRTATQHAVGAALGELAPTVAVAGPSWRPPGGCDLDLAVPSPELDAVAAALSAAGLIPVAWHAGPGRRALARMEDGRVVDLVDLEAIGAAAIAPAGPGGGGQPDGSGLSTLHRDAAVARLCRTVVHRGAVALVHLADAEALGVTGPAQLEDETARCGWRALVATAGRLAAGPIDLPAVIACGPEPRRSLPVDIARVAGRLVGRRQLEVTARIVFTGRPEAAAHATALVDSLHRASLDVHPVTGPTRASYTRAAVRAAHHEAILVAVFPDRSGQRLFPPPTLLVRVEPLGSMTPEGGLVLPPSEPPDPAALTLTLRAVLDSLQEPRHRGEPRLPSPRAGMQRMAATASPQRASRRGAAEACVLGDVDLVAALGMAGVRSVAVVDRGDPAAFSRFVRGRIEPLDHWREPAAFVDRLLGWAAHQQERPVLYYQTDGDLRMASRYRTALAAGFRFVLPDAELVEALVDKACFAALAERLGLHVPPSRVLTAAAGPAPALELAFPLVVKPLSRQGLGRLEPHAKALLVKSPEQLTALWPGVAAADVDVLAQQLISGPETRVESYHAYVDAAGEIAGEFTGEKIRTYPPTFGHSTALRTSAAPDVRAQGRADVRTLGLSGVVKVDYKRAPDGRLWLLEVNPRFTLWHHLGAAAGVNLAGLVHADLTGRPRPATAPARPGVTWCHPWEDRWAAAATGLGRGRWAWQAARSAARSGADLGDPLPFLRGMLWPRLRRRVGGGPGRRGNETIERSR